MEVILLGTGGPRPDPRRMATTTLIRLGEENILIDAGRGVMVQLSKAGVPLGSINTVFLTHHHFDHIGDLYDVMLNSWLHGREDDLRIYGPPDTERLVNTLITQVYDKDIAWRDQGEPTFGGWKPVVATDIIPGPVLDTGRWKISAELVSHGDGLDMSPAFLARWMCLGFRFEAEGKVIAISGDTVPCPGLERLAEGAVEARLPRLRGPRPRARPVVLLGALRASRRRQPAHRRDGPGRGGGRLPLERAASPPPIGQVVAWL